MICYGEALYWMVRHRQVAEERDALLDELECLRYHHAACKVEATAVRQATPHLTTGAQPKETR